MSTSIRKARHLARRLYRQLTSQRLQLFPIRTSIRGYDATALRADTRAGIVVALLAVPQGMAFAMIAGLPPLLGVSAAVVGLVLGAVFSGGRHVSYGPSVTIAVLLLSTFVQLDITPEQRPEAVAIVLLFAGLILVIGAGLNLGLMTRFVSRSVSMGFIIAAGLLILASQMKAVLGLDLPESGVFALDVMEVLRHLGEIHWPDAAVALATAGVYMTFRLTSRRLPGAFSSLAVGTLVGWFLESRGLAVRHLVGVEVTPWHADLVSGFQFSWTEVVINTAFATALLAHIEVSLIGRSFAARAGDRFDANQHMFAAGMANLGNAFFGGMPCSVSLPRTRLNRRLGARTAVASVVAGLAALLALVALTPVVHWIPRASLAALAIVFATEIFSRHYVTVIIRSTPADAFVLVATVLTGLFLRLDTALYIGAGLSILFFLRRVGVPQMVEYGFTEQGQLASIDKDGRVAPEISIVHVEGDLFFGAAEIFLEQARRVFEEPNLKIIILRMKNAHHLDATCAMAIEELIRFARKHNRHVIVSGAHRQIYRVFRDSGLLDLLGRENFFMDIPSNPTRSTRNALLRAREILGGESANIRIYVDAAKKEAEASAQP